MLGSLGAFGDDGLTWKPEVVKSQGGPGHTDRKFFDSRLPKDSLTNEETKGSVQGIGLGEP